MKSVHSICKTVKRLLEYAIAAHQSIESSPLPASLESIEQDPHTHTLHKMLVGIVRVDTAAVIDVATSN